MSECSYTDIVKQILRLFIDESEIPTSDLGKLFGSGALSGKMMLVRIIENNKIDAYFRSG